MGRKAVAGIGAEARHALPAAFASALGQCVADFGWLEETIKRAIYSLDRARLAEDLKPEELQRWLTRISGIADDSMGTLIEQLDAAMRRNPGISDRNQITDELGRIKQQRNLLCHASWRPTDDPARWHPAFVNTHGEVADRAISMAELEQLSADTTALGARVLAVLHGSGVESYWAGDDQP